MADWNIELPAEAVEGAETHVEDHNKIVDAMKEVRTSIDEHKHDASDITSGTLAAGRIPTIAQSKVTGLTDLVTRLETLESKVEALETEPEE